MKRIIVLLLICCSFPQAYTGVGVISTNWKHVYKTNLIEGSIGIEIENVTREDTGECIEPTKIL